MQCKHSVIELALIADPLGLVWQARVWHVTDGERKGGHFQNVRLREAHAPEKALEGLLERIERCAEAREFETEEVGEL